MANTTIGRVTVGQRQSTTITSPNWPVSLNVALADITDVSTANVENGHALIYNSVTEKYEMKAFTEFPNIFGGTF
jgi:hypothetical protein